MRLGPRPHGQPWTPADDAQLLELLDAKVDRASIARKLNRTEAAVDTRNSLLKKRREGELRLKAKGK